MTTAFCGQSVAARQTRDGNTRLPSIREEVAHCGVIQKRRFPAPHGPPNRDTGVIGIQRGSYVLPAETVRAAGGARVLDDFVERTTGRRPPRPSTI